MTDPDRSSRTAGKQKQQLGRSANGKPTERERSGDAGSIPAQAPTDTERLRVIAAMDVAAIQPGPRADER